MIKIKLEKVEVEITFELVEKFIDALANIEMEYMKKKYQQA